MKIYVVTQYFHYDGMDSEKTETIAVYTDPDEATARAILESERWMLIANDAEIEEMDTDVPLDADEEDVYRLLEQLDEREALANEEVQKALDLLLPNWRELVPEPV